MKTIAYKDLAGGAMKSYYMEGQTRHERIKKALDELHHVGNIVIYLIDGNKIRRLSKHSF